MQVTAKRKLFCGIVLCLFLAAEKRLLFRLGSRQVFLNGPLHHADLIFVGACLQHKAVVLYADYLTGKTADCYNFIADLKAVSYGLFFLLSFSLRADKQKIHQHQYAAEENI